MRAIRFHSKGGPEVLQLDEIPTPVPGAGEVRIALRFAGVNFIDTYFRSGLYDAGPLPARVGKEGAGVVTAVGDGVGDGIVGPRVGDRVAFWSATGSYADEVLLPAAQALPLPSALSFELGAALPLQGMTAHYLVHGIRPVVSGHTVLIHAAAGGVGLLACQLAKRAGARVFGTCSTPAKAELARAAGCDEVILYTETSVRLPNTGRGENGAIMPLDWPKTMTVPRTRVARTLSRKVVWPTPSMVRSTPRPAVPARTASAKLVSV